MGENDAHPLTEEQLDALVDEIQDRLADSTARKVGRRGVLAALGVATLGTGSASAQASGSVGTSSSPVDVFAYNLAVANQMTSSLPMGGNDIENAGSVSTDQTVTGRFNADNMLVTRGRPNSDIEITNSLEWTDIPTANVEDQLNLSPDGGDTITLSQFRTCQAFGKVRIDGLNDGDLIQLRLSADHDGGPIYTQTRRAAEPDENGVFYLPIVSTQTLEDHNAKWQVRNGDSATGTIRSGNQNTNLTLAQTLIGGFNAPTR